jgi:hypothetical protein
MLVALPHIATAEDQGQNEGDHHHSDHEAGHQERTVRFHIRLTGDQQVPPVDTTAFGFAEVQLSEDIRGQLVHEQNDENDQVEASVN